MMAIKKKKKKVGKVHSFTFNEMKVINIQNWSGIFLIDIQCYHIYLGCLFWKFFLGV